MVERTELEGSLAAQSGATSEEVQALRAELEKNASAAAELERKFVAADGQAMVERAAKESAEAAAEAQKAELAKAQESYNWLESERAKLEASLAEAQAATQAAFEERDAATAK